MICIEIVAIFHRRAASVQIKWSLSLWFVSSVREICLLCFVNSELTTWLHFIKKWLWLLQVRRPVIKYFLNSSGQYTIGFWYLRLFAFSDSLLFQIYESLNPTLLKRPNGYLNLIFIALIFVLTNLKLS